MVIINVFGITLDSSGARRRLEHARWSVFQLPR